MYTKAIHYKKYLPRFDVWVDQRLRTTDDAIWLHITAMSIDNNIKQIVVKDIEK